MIWAEKYRPQKPEYMVGNDDARARFYLWLKNWTPGTKPALLLGPPGTGKTTLVHATAKQLGYDVLELNASDYRTRAILERRLRPAMGGLTVFGTKLLVFLDEVDGLYGRADYGGAEYILRLLSKITVPLVMAANKEDVGHMPELEKASLVILFRRVPARLIELYLRYVLEKEKKSIDRDTLIKIVKYSRGDVRAAVNALQSAVLTGRFEGGYKDIELSLKEAITEAASVKSVDLAYSILRMASAQPQDKIRAVYAALTMSSLGDSRKLARALRMLSEADILYSRIIRTQNWKLLRYMDRILAASLAGTFVSYSEYDTPYQVSTRIWNEGRVYRKLAEMAARIYHVSKKEFMTYYFDTFVLAVDGNARVLSRLSQLLGEDKKTLKEVFESERKRLLGARS